MKKFLQVVGVLTLLGILGASVAALLTVKEHLHLTIAGETADRKTGPDPVALLRDDVASLRRDLDALSQALTKNFEALAAHEDEADAERRTAVERAVAPLQEALARLQEGLAASERAQGDRAEAVRQETLAGLGDLRERVDRLAQARSAALAARPLEPETAAGAAPPAPGAKVAATGEAPALARPAAAPLSTAAAAPTPTAPTAPARRKGFLSFSLPSQSLDFDKALSFEIVPSLSRVGFDAKSTLHDFSGVTSEVTGSFVARLSQPGTGTSGQVRADAASLDTGIQERNGEMAGALEAKRFPTLEFTLTAFEPQSVDPKTKASTGTARGTMTIHGVARPVSIPLRISVDESRRVAIEGEVPLRMTDFGVTPPKKMGLIAVEDEVRVWVALRARAVGEAK